MGVLFLVSLGTGWWLSGRALRPVPRITATAQEISATDLSRRIALDGPRDELRNLADTPPEDRAQATAIVSRAIQRTTRLVEDLLASARRSSPAFVDADVDLAAIAGEAAEEYELLAADRELSRRTTPVARPDRGR